MKQVLLLLFFIYFFAFSSASLPSPVNGIWLLTADDTVPMPNGWFPKIRSTYPFNTYWLSFLNPNTIFQNGQTQAPPSSYTQFSLNRDLAGGPKSTDKVIYSIGGYSYSQGSYIWGMFDNKNNAINFANAVLSWKQTYKVDGFDLDWETASLSDVQKEAILTFIFQIKQADPSFIITIEEAGYPQYAGALLIQYAHATNRLTQLIESVDAFNVMYYSVDAAQTAKYWVVNDWQKDCTNWCPLGTTIPSDKIILGLPGCCDQSPTISALQSMICSNGNDGQKFRGIMTWYVSSDSADKIQYQGSCGGSGGCALDPDHADYFKISSCGFLNALA